MAVVHFALLVRADAAKGFVVCRRVILYGNKRRHPSDRQRPPLMTGLTEQFGVAVHTRLRHVHGKAVCHDAARLQFQRLDHAEDVIPAATVEPHHVIPQLVENFIHLKRCGQRLDEHCRLDRAPVHTECVLGGNEYVVPQPRLEVRLQLGQVKVRPRAAFDQRPCVVEEIQREIDDRCWRWRAVDQHVLFHQVPATRSHD